MTKRRDCIKTSALSVLGSSLAFVPTKAEAQSKASSIIIKQPEDCETFYVRKNTPITFHLVKKQDSINAISMCSEEIQTGGQIPTHKHIHADEYFYFISGNGVIISNEIETAFKPGNTAYVPRDTWHCIKNTGTEIVRMIQTPFCATTDGSLWNMAPSL